MLVRLIQNFFLFLCCILAFTCRETIEFEPPKSIRNAIFIEGKLIKGDPSVVQVKIGQVFDFIANPSLLLTQYVLLIDENENTLELKTQEQGIFELTISKDHPTFKVEYGSAYKIKLELKNEAIYESAYDTLYQVPEPANLKVDKISKNVVFSDGMRETQEIVRFNVSTPTTTANHSKPYLMWELISVYQQTDFPTGTFGLQRCPITGPPKTCYLTISPVENYPVLNTRDLTSSFVSDFTIFEADNTNTFVFAEGYYLTAYQQSLSQSAFEYWSQANQLVDRDGTIFEAPAGKISTNFYNIADSDDEVFGYFYATESKLIRTYVSPEYVGNPRSRCPEVVDMHSVFCDNCLCEENATTVKPEWWIE